MPPPLPPGTARVLPMQLQIGVAARRVLSAHLDCDGLRRVRLGVPGRIDGAAGLSNLYGGRVGMDHEGDVRTGADQEDDVEAMEKSTITYRYVCGARGIRE